MYLLSFFINCCILPILYLFGFLFISKFNINDNIVKNIILLILNIIIYPVFFILANNLYLFAWRKKSWKNWFIILRKHEKIIDYFEIGLGMVLFFPIIYLIKIFGNNIKIVIKKDVIFLLIITLIFTLLFIFIKKLMIKIFIKDE
jgi:hypothetical protein